VRAPPRARGRVLRELRQLRLIDEHRSLGLHLTPSLAVTRSFVAAAP
jgi:hypothetical protein